MSRPLMIVGFVFLFSLIVICNFFSSVSLGVLIILLVLSALTIPLIIKKKGILASVVCLTVTAAYIMMYVFTVTQYKPVLEYVGDNQTVVAEALTYPEDTISGSTCDMKIKKISGREVNIKTVVYFDGICDINPYETYEIKADLEGVYSEDDTDKSYKSDGIYLITKADNKVKFISSRNTVSGFFLNIKKTLSDRINENLSSDVAAFVNAISLGDRSFLEAETVDAFNITGTSHILAVSGLHISIWVLSFYTFLRKIALNEKIASVCGIVLYFLLLFIVGFRYSVIRAGIMLIVMLSANFFERDYDSKSSLGLAVLIICMINPFAVMNNGFLMSVFATLGILVIFPPLYEILTKPIENRHGFFSSLAKGIISTAAITLSANIILIPIYIFSIKSFPLIAVVSNLLIIAFSSIVMVSGICVAVFANVPILSDFFNGVAQYIGKFILLIIEKLADVPFASINTSNNFFKVWLIVSLVICALSLIFITDNKRRLKLNALLCALALVFSYATYFTIEYGITKVDLLSKNQGFAVIVREEDVCVVIDYSGSNKTYKEVKRYLQKEFISKIDFLVCDSDSEILKMEDKIGQKVFMDKTEKFSLTVENTVAINYFDKYNDCIYFEVGDTSAVVTTNSKTDYDALPNDLKSADILVCNNKIPDSFNVGNYGNILISEKSNNGLTADMKYKNAYSTAKLSMITYRAADNGDYEIRSAY